MTNLEQATRTLRYGGTLEDWRRTRQTVRAEAARYGVDRESVRETLTEFNDEDSAEVVQ